MQITMSDLGPVRRLLMETEKQARFATAQAFTKTGQLIKQAQKESIQSVFDRPKPWTTNSVFLKPAKKDNLSARVWIKDHAAKGTPAVKYLPVHINGGEKRSHTKFEKALIYKGVIRANDWLVPARTVPLDKYGNPKPGLYIQILSGLKAFRDDNNTGFIANRSTSARSSRKKRFFLKRFKSRKGQWKRGIFRRKSARVDELLFLVVKRPHYKKIFPFWSTAQKVIDQNLLKIWDESFKNAMRTARG